jgi:hypothetical protein
MHSACVLLVGNPANLKFKFRGFASPPSDGFAFISEGAVPLKRRTC